MSFDRIAGRLETFCQKEVWQRGVKFWFRHTYNAGGEITVSIAEPLTLRTVNEGERFIEPQPSLSMRDEEAQQLVDELWRLGFRPTEGTGSAGSLAATERHLADMRHLVFKTKPPA